MHHLYHGYASHDHSYIIFRNVINKYWHLFRDIVTWSATLAYSKGTSQARMACTNPPTRYVHRLCKVFRGRLAQLYLWICDEAHRKDLFNLSRKQLANIHTFMKT